MSIYTVKTGDTLGKIAAEFKNTVKDLASSNGITNPNLIYPGQKIQVGENVSNYDTFSAKTSETGSATNNTKNEKTQSALKAQIADIDFSKFSNKIYEEFLKDAQWLSEEEIQKRAAELEKKEKQREKEYKKILNLTASNGLKYGDAKNTMDEIARKYCNPVKKTGDFTISVDLRPMKERMTPEDRAKYEAAEKAVEEIEKADSRIGRAYSIYKISQQLGELKLVEKYKKK